MSGIDIVVGYVVGSQRKKAQELLARWKGVTAHDQNTPGI